MGSLYELSNDFKRLQLFAEDEEVDADALADTYEAMQMELDDKAVGTAYVLKNLDAQAEILKNEIDRLSKRKKAFENKATRLKELLKNAMDAAQVTEITKDPRFKIAIQTNGGVKPLKFIDGEIVPLEWYTTPEPIIDNKKVREALNAGEILPFAYLGERGTSLRIK